MAHAERRLHERDARAQNCAACRASRAETECIDRHSSQNRTSPTCTQRAGAAVKRAPASKGRGRIASRVAQTCQPEHKYCRTPTKSGDAFIEEIACPGISRALTDPVRHSIHVYVHYRRARVDLGTIAEGTGILVRQQPRDNSGFCANGRNKTAQRVRLAVKVHRGEMR